MLEQTKINGRVFNVKTGKKSVLSRPAVIPDIVFGPYRPVMVYRVTDNEMWVRDENRHDWYHYKGDDELLSLISKETVHMEEQEGSFYLYGMAEVTNENKEVETVPYFVQDTPYVQKRIIPAVESMEMPFSMRALDYDRTFTYPNALKELLRDCPAAYADRFKRPIIRPKGHTYPISLDKQSFKWEELPDARYPVVVDLGGTNFAVLDLEPSRSSEEERVYESIMGYYEEETIRGGKHKLVRLDDPTFKFRYGSGLELIVNGLVTFYGIKGVMLSSNPEPMKTTGFVPVGYTARMIKPMDMPEEIEALTAKLEAYVEDLPSIREQIRKKHRLNMDNSNREFHMLLDLYNTVLKPRWREFPEDTLPWILVSCAGDMIEPREKHATNRNGVPYLVYLSAIICQERDGAKLWKPSQE